VSAQTGSASSFRAAGEFVKNTAIAFIPGSGLPDAYNEFQNGSKLLAVGMVVTELPVFKPFKVGFKVLKGMFKGSKSGNRTFFRNMSRGEAQAVRNTGKLRGGNQGDTFFTDQRFRTGDRGARAQDRLSLPQRPEVQMEFRIRNNPNLQRNGTRVTPANGGRGGGREFMTTDPVDVEIINVQPF